MKERKRNHKRQGRRKRLRQSEEQDAENVAAEEEEIAGEEQQEEEEAENPTLTKAETEAWERLTKERQDFLSREARRLHVNSGHRPTRVLIGALRRRGAPPEAICAMKKLSCSALFGKPESTASPLCQP
jgi:hypothetical protein